MNYITNYYKNLSEQLQEKVNVLNYKLRLLTEDPFYGDDNIIDDPDHPLNTPRKPAGVPGGLGGFDGQEPREAPVPVTPDIKPGYEQPHKGGPGMQWSDWIRSKGGHKGNPHRYGSKEWTIWEWNYYQRFGVEKHTKTKGWEGAISPLRMPFRRPGPRGAPPAVTKDIQLGRVLASNIKKPPPMTEEYRRFLEYLKGQDGRWHEGNPHLYGSPEWVIWEAEHYYTEDGYLP
jgi:hypothetical protein